MIHGDFPLFEGPADEKKASWLTCMFVLPMEAMQSVVPISVNGNEVFWGGHLLVDNLSWGRFGWTIEGPTYSFVQLFVKIHVGKVVAHSTLFWLTHKFV